jgi:hypothetical protein
MSNIVEFPPSDRPITESEIDKLHSEAFRNLEPSICDCESMAKIAAQIAMNTQRLRTANWYLRSFTPWKC